MPTQIKLPSLGENIESGDVLSILVSEGDVVAKDQDLLELETDKATMPVPSPQAGRIVKVLISEGQTVPVGAALFEIEAESGAAAKPKRDEGAKASAEAPVAPAKEKPQYTPQAEAAADETAAVAEQLEEPEETPPPRRP
ncbi:MAG: pyruvate dehydrogenase, partial [Planctomycetota bacterium]